MRSITLLLLALTVLGCREHELPDADADGVADALDCAPDDASVYPDAPELCNDRDDDCDGATDEDATDASTWYRDSDLDTHGDAGRTLRACTQPEGYAELDDDCDDDNGLAFPGADERCNGEDDDCDGATDEDPVDPLTWYADGDGDGHGVLAATALGCTAPDGYAAFGDDCDDSDPDVHPDHPEECDTKDNDCDGATDEDAVDAPTWYLDYDGDTHGDPGSTRDACAQPTGYVASSDDCDDDDVLQHPGADERCNSEDDDCDGTTDEDAVDAPTWYLDSDGDTWGVSSSSVQACTNPRGYAADSGDCDDADPLQHPSAPEVCNDADDDCDGTADDNPTGAPTWYADTDGDTYGDPALALTACDAPAGYVGNDEDCDDTRGAVHPAALEVCDGLDNDCSGMADGADADGTRTWYGDADADGYGDPAAAVRACSAPAGTVTRSTDCDDGDATAYPGGTEVCDLADNDCNGTADDHVASPPAWYPDRDGDGYGDPSATPTLACAGPAGSVADGTDCDDTTAAAHPGGLDVCGDGVDGDCLDGDHTCPAYGDLVLTEVQYTGTEWAEVLNESSTDLDLQGLVLSHGASQEVIATSVPVPAHTRVVLGASAAAPEWAWSLSLSDTDGTLVLAEHGPSSTAGATLTEAPWDEAAMSAGVRALSLDPEALDQADPVAAAADLDWWCAGSTPGTANDRCPWPEVLRIDPGDGLDAGGQTLRLLGTDLDALTDLEIDGTTVAFTPVDDVEVRIVSPAHAAGWVDVDASDGVHTRTLVDGFLFTGTAHTVGWGKIQYPASASEPVGAAAAFFGRVYQPGVTNPGGQGAGIRAQLGWGPVGSYPDTDPGWTWVEASYNGDLDNDDEYVAWVTWDAPGTWGYAYRFTRDDGVNWLYVDTLGSDAGDRYDPTVAGSLTVY